MCRLYFSSYQVCWFLLAGAKQFHYLSGDLGRGENFALHIEGEKKEKKIPKENKKRQNTVVSNVPENLLSVYNREQNPSLAKGEVILQLRMQL